MIIICIYICTWALCVRACMRSYMYIRVYIIYIKLIDYWLLLIRSNFMRNFAILSNHWLCALNMEISAINVQGFRYFGYYSITKCITITLMQLYYIINYYIVLYYNIYCNNYNYCYIILRNNCLQCCWHGSSNLFSGLEYLESSFEFMNIIRILDTLLYFVLLQITFWIEI